MIPADNSGTKADNSKPRYDLLAPELLELTSKVLTFGANKYGDRNWERGMDWHRPFAALMRHMWAWWRGETLDPETNLPHLAHAACNIMFLLTFEQRKIGTDDRNIIASGKRPVLETFKDWPSFPLMKP